MCYRTKIKLFRKLNTAQVAASGAVTCFPVSESPATVAGAPAPSTMSSGEPVHMPFSPCTTS